MKYYIFIVTVFLWMTSCLIGENYIPRTQDLKVKEKLQFFYSEDYIKMIERRVMISEERGNDDHHSTRRNKKQLVKIKERQSNLLPDELKTLKAIINKSKKLYYAYSEGTGSEGFSNSPGLQSS